MTVTEQLDGLRALAIDPVRFLVVPRVIAMIVMLVALTVIGDLVALLGASVVGRAMLDIDWSTMYYSFADNLKPYDFLHGIYKSIAFGGAIAVSSCYFGVTVRGGAVGVGRAVNAAVVAAAVSIMLLDFFLTYTDRMNGRHAHASSVSAAPSSTRRAPASSCGSSTSRRSPASSAAVARAAAAAARRASSRARCTRSATVARVHRRHARLHRHGDDVPGVPAALARHRRLLAGRRAVHPAHRLRLRPDADRA